MRIGFGYDIHRLIKNRKLMIGGIEIPHTKGEAGHSDGDVLLHAIIDALLGAMGLKDIGTFFPPEDPAYKDIPSRNLLSVIRKKVQDEGFFISNLDCTVIIEKPKLKPYIDAIISLLAEDLETDKKNIAVKAKTKEGIGKVGKGKAIEAYAAVLINHE